MSELKPRSFFLIGGSAGHPFRPFGAHHGVLPPFVDAAAAAAMTAGPQRRVESLQALQGRSNLGNDRCRSPVRPSAKAVDACMLTHGYQEAVDAHTRVSGGGGCSHTGTRRRWMLTHGYQEAVDAHTRVPGDGGQVPGDGGCV